MESWQPCLRIRAVTKVGGLVKDIEQLWRNIHSGETEWRSIERVQEELPAQAGMIDDE